MLYFRKQAGMSLPGAALTGALTSGSAAGLLSLVHNLTRLNKKETPPQSILQNAALAALPGALVGGGIGTMTDDSITPENAEAVRKALLSAGIGGGTGAIMGAITEKPQFGESEERSTSRLKNTLLRNALLGGTAGAGISAL